MSMNNRKIAGFMSAESIYSLAFYIVMVAAIAGVGAGVMTKTATAKAVSALALLRANYQAETSVSGFATPVTAAQLVKLSGGLLTAGGANDATLTGAGTFAIVNKTANPATGFGINITGVTSPDVCKAVGSVGWGTWDALAGEAIASATVVTAANLITTRNGAAGAGDLLTVCNAATPAAAVTLGFLSQ